MLLLENGNRILKDTILARYEVLPRDPDDPNAVPKRPSLDITFADFDGVQFHVSTNPEDRAILLVSIQTRCGAELLRYGGTALLQTVYGGLVEAEAESGYDVTLRIDLNALPADKEAFSTSISLLKRHLFAAPFLYAFDLVTKRTPAAEIMAVNYRSDESFYIKTENDRVTVIFQVAFKDADDIVLSRVFLQAFDDERKRINGAPAVSFTQRDAPGELRGVPGVRVGDGYGFVSFVLFEQHINARNRDRTADLIQTFRDYLHYHIKCSKAYMHTRMRDRVDAFLTLLNNAKPAPLSLEKKTASGRTFTRQGPK